MQPHRIVVIEDDHSIRSMYQFKLENVGFAVKTASDGEQGLEIIKEFKPDLILLDLKMPVMGGGEMLERLRASEWGSGIRVIILTNISKDEAPMNLRFLSVDRYVVKAHQTPSQIVDIVNEILQTKKSA